MGFFQSNQLTVELEETAHRDRGTGPPHGCGSTPGMISDARHGGIGGATRYLGPHPLPVPSKPGELPERDQVLLPRPDLARVLEVGLHTCALA